MILDLIAKDKSGIWNLPGGLELSNLQLVELLRAMIPESKSEIIFVEDRKGHDFRYSMNPDEFSKEIGLPKFMSISEGLLETVNWYKKSTYA